MILSGRARHKGTLAHYIEYLHHLHTKFQTSSPGLSVAAGSHGVEDKVTQLYRDYLQAPLQPLMDNLESQVYETFEKDPIKYEKYEEAIRLALLDIMQARVSSPAALASDISNGDHVQTAPQPVIVTVVGAGRGPLVQCALSAARAAGALVRIYAIEKNANAIVTLRNRVLTEQWTNVFVVSIDMRRWQPDELADVMVSELLGSWGDNELSPECLDGAQRCLKAGGISIPSEYISFVAPLSSAKLWSNAGQLLEGKVCHARQ